MDAPPDVVVSVRSEDMIALNQLLLEVDALVASMTTPPVELPIATTAPAARKMLRAALRRMSVMMDAKPHWRTIVKRSP